MIDSAAGNNTANKATRLQWTPLRALLAIRPTFLTVLIAITAIYFLIQPPGYATTDGYVREFVARNLITYRSPALIQVEQGETLNDLWSYGRDGRPYAYFGLGQSLLLIPFMLLLRQLDTLGIAQYLSPTVAIPMATTLSISGALLVASVFGIAQELGYSRRTSLLTAGMVAFASTLWGMVRTSFDMSIEAAFVMAAIYCILASQRHEQRRTLHLLAGGFCFGFAIVTRIGALIAGPALALLLLTWPERPFNDRFKRAILFGVGAFTILWVVPYYNWVRYENALSLGYTGHYPYAGGPILRGLADWLISPWQGALVYMPVLFALSLCWKAFYHKHKYLFTALIVLFLSYLLFHAQFVGLGRHGWGPYYVMSGIFPLYLIFAEFIEHWLARPAWQRTFFAGLAGLTFTIQLAAISVPMERQQVEIVVYDAQGLGDYENFNFWNVRWSPLHRQALATINNVRNLPRAAEFADTPPSLAYPDLLKHLFSYNLPDWWWLYKFVNHSEIALIVPLMALIAAAWLAAHILHAPQQV